MKSRVTTIIVLCAVMFCQADSLLAKQWLLLPDSEQEITPVQINPQRQSIDRAKLLLAKGDYKKSEKTLRNFLKKSPDSALAPEAIYYLAQTLEKRGKLYDAFETYEQIADGSSDSEYFPQAIRAEFGIARQFLNGTKRQVMGIFKISAEAEGKKIMHSVAERLPGSLLAEQSLMELGDYHLRKKQYDDAVAAYDLLIGSYPSSTLIRQARLASAKAHLGKFNGAAFDPAPLIEAKERLLEYNRLYQADEHAGEVQAMLQRIDDSQAQHQYQVGCFYQRTGKAQSARLSFEELLKRWPDSKWATKAQAKLKKLAKAK